MYTMYSLVTWKYNINNELLNVDYSFNVFGNYLETY